MRPILIARVSTDEQKEAGNSIPAQFVRMENYCRNKGFKVDDKDKISFDESAYKQNRKKFDEFLENLIAIAQKEKVAVCFDKVDRLSRNIFDKRVSKLYEMAVADIIELHFVSDGQVINNQMSAVQKFQFGMSLGLAKYYSDAISDTTKRALETKRKNGEVTGGKVPPGYKWDKDEKGNSTVVIDWSKAHLIKRLFEMYSTGLHSYQELSDIMYKDGLRSLGGKKIPISGISYILHNTFYYGLPMSQKYGKYPSFHSYGNIITKDLYDKCQEVREMKNRNVFKSISKEFVFKGLLLCQNCGCRITAEEKRKPSGLTYNIYSCTNGKRICKRYYVNENDLLKPILKDLKKLSGIPKEVAERLVSELRKNSEQEVEHHKKEIARVRNDIDKLSKKKDALVDALLDKSITKDVYDKKLQEIEDATQLRSTELDEHYRADTDYKTTIGLVFSVAQRAEQIFLSSEPEEKRQFLNFLLQNPVVNGKNLYYTMKSPFNLLLNLPTHSNWGAQWELNPH